MIPSAEISANDRPDIVSTKPAVPRRRCLSFSLRTMLIVITLVTIPMGLLINSAKRQERAVTMILGLREFQPGMSVWYENEVHDYVQQIDAVEIATFDTSVTSKDLQPHTGKSIQARRFQQSRIPEWLVRLVGPDYFYNVERVVLNFGPRFTPSTRVLDENGKPSGISISTPMEIPSKIEDNKTISYLADLRHLKRLFVVDYGNRKFDANRLLEIVGGISKLEELDLYFGWRKVNHDKIAALKKLRNLEEFQLRAVLIESDADFAKFGELDLLTYAIIGLDASVTPAGLKLERPLLKIGALEIESIHPIKAENLDSIARSFPKLEVITVHNLPDIRELTPLRTLSLRYLNLSFQYDIDQAKYDAYLEILKREFKGCKISIDRGARPTFAEQKAYASSGK